MEKTVLYKYELDNRNIRHKLGDDSELCYYAHIRLYICMYIWYKWKAQNATDIEISENSFTTLKSDQNVELHSIYIL